MSKTQLAILWGLGVLIVAILGTFGLLLSQTQRPQALSPTAGAANTPVAERQQGSAYRLPEMPHTARNLYDQAEQAAQSWQPDGELVSAAASWPFASLDDFSRPVDWTFQFYSPTTGRLYVINVDRETVTPIRETLSPYSLPTIDVERWQVDSHQALNAWLNRGGGAFLKRHAVVDVSIRLARPQGGDPVWTVLGLEENGEAIQTERVAAQGPSP